MPELGAKDVKQLEIDEKTLNRNSIQGIEAKSYNPFATDKLIERKLAQLRDKDRFDLVESERLDGTLLFSHNPDTDQFGKRELATTYDLSYNQQIKVGTQYNSRFEPDAACSSRHFHREAEFEKDYQRQVPDTYDRRTFQDQREARPYRPHVRSFDAEHMKTPFLREP